MFEPTGTPTLGDRHDDTGNRLESTTGRPLHT
jgi:hypothetical protein